jgi:cytochrome c5
MKYAPFLIALAAASMVACGKTEEAPAVNAVPAQVESAAVVTPGESMQAATPTDATSATTPPPVAESIAAAKPSQPAPAAPVNTAASITPKSDLAHGEQIYRQACAFCHDKGVAGAPKTGDAAAWGPRLAQGMDALYASALRGKGAMPAKGGNPSLADGDAKAAVDYLAAQAR